MTIKECIDIVDNVKPNQYSTKDKVMWLSFIDEKIINDVLETHEGYDGRYDDFEGYSEDKLSVPLIVGSPYDRLYPAYLKMRIDGENGETARYNNSADLFNTYYMEFAKYYNKTHMPLNASYKRNKAPQVNKYNVTDAMYESLKRDLYNQLSNEFAAMVSNDKIADVVRDFVNTNVQMLKGKDGYTPIKGVDYFDGEDAITDQTYTSNSPNAQSGIAVNEAINLHNTDETAHADIRDRIKVTYIESPNENNIRINLRTLESGVYVLYGKFDEGIYFPYETLALVSKGVGIQAFLPKENLVRCYDFTLSERATVVTEKNIADLVTANNISLALSATKELQLIGGDKMLRLNSNENAGFYDANDPTTLIGIEVSTPETNMPYAAANKQYVDEKNALQNETFANALKGYAKGAGSVTISDISPIEHKVEITETPINLINVYSASALSFNNNTSIELTENIVPNAEYLIVCSSPDGLSEGSEMCLYSIQTFKTNVPVNGRTTFIVQPETYESKYLQIFSGNSVGGDGKYIYVEQIDIYRMEVGTDITKKTALSVYPEMTITSEDENIKIEVIYNRDICKAIENIENALGLVNTTLASVVEVE